MYYVMYAWVWLKTRYLRTRGKLYTWHRDFPVYLRTIRLNPAFPRMDTAPCQETEYPYRDGTTLMLRLAGSFGVTVAILNSHPDLTDKAINGRLIAALTSADGTAAYWDTPERRAEAVEVPEELLITAEDTVESVEQ
jgi:hypothetical protein